MARATTVSPVSIDRLPADVVPAALAVIAEQVRSDAAETMRYFADQHVEVKVVSGDNPVTVSAVATRLGVPGAARVTRRQRLSPPRA